MIDIPGPPPYLPWHDGTRTEHTADRRRFPRDEPGPAQRVRTPDRSAPRHRRHAHPGPARLHPRPPPRTPAAVMVDRPAGRADILRARARDVAARLVRCGDRAHVLP